MSKTKWTWQDIQVVSHPDKPDRVMLLCPGPDCYEWYVQPSEFNPSLELLRRLAKDHIQKVHR